MRDLDLDYRGAIVRFRDIVSSYFQSLDHDVSEAHEMMLASDRLYRYPRKIVWIVERFFPEPRLSFSRSLGCPLVLQSNAITEKSVHPPALSGLALQHL